MGFYVFDYFSTLLHWSHLCEEDGCLPYLFMQFTGSVSISLTLNLLIKAAFWFLFFHNLVLIVIRFIQAPYQNTGKPLKLPCLRYLFFPSINFAAATS